MRWPWQRAEVRESQPFTDAVVSAIAEQAGGASVGDPSAIAALETAAGLYARAFAAATVEPAHPAITPAVLALIARGLIRRGESLHLVDVDGGAPVLIPAGSWDVRGPWRESEWWYRLDLFGPSGNVTKFVPADAVAHFRYAFDPARPWLGLSPLQWARDTGVLAANLERRLGEEAGGSTARLLPVPADGGDGDEDTDPLAKLKGDISNAKGRALVIETTSAGWGDGKSAAPLADWKQQRVGPDPPEALGALRTAAGLAVLNACGVPVSLATDADGTSQRESWRRFVMGSVEPVARMVAVELARKLDVPGLRFDFSSLWAHDLAGRAASFKAMIAGGMDLERAVALSGLAAGDG